MSNALRAGDSDWGGHDWSVGGEEAGGTRRLTDELRGEGRGWERCKRRKRRNGSWGRSVL